MKATKALSPSRSAMSASPILSVEQLCLHRGDRRLAQALDFKLHTGESGLLHGGNGSGKTTFMETLCGLLPVTEGLIQHVGRIGYVAQEPRFPEHLRCASYLMQLHALGAKSNRNAKANVDTALGLFQLEKHRSDTIGSLSRGWRQRMNLARAWLSSPELLLLDEPQTALDPEGMAALQEAIEMAAASAVLLVAPEGVGCDALAPLIGSLTPIQESCSA